MGVISIDCTGRHEFRRDQSSINYFRDISEQNRGSDEKEVRDHSDSDDVSHGGGQCDGMPACVRHAEQCAYEGDTATEEERVRPDSNAGQCGPSGSDDHIEQ